MVPWVIGRSYDLPVRLSVTVDGPDGASGTDGGGTDRTYGTPVLTAGFDGLARGARSSVCSLAGAPEVPMGMWELILVFAIVVLFFGASRLPGLGEGLGKALLAAGRAH